MLQSAAARAIMYLLAHTAHNGGIQMVMKDIISAAEGAGLYVESHQGGLAQEDTELYCRACGKTLMVIPKGEMTFTQTHGQCSCSWCCCAFAQPGNSSHPRHLAHRPKVTPEVMLREGRY